MEKVILGYTFEFVDNINPEVDRLGNIKEYFPHTKYDNIKDINLNKYGEGPFCKFSIPPKWKQVSGVYSYYISDQLVYIGQCVDFGKRINAGYGNISPRNCYEGGQPTNCKINKMVLNASRAGKKISLYFHKTNNFDEVERMLIAKYKPKYNSSLKGGSNRIENNIERSVKPISISYIRTNALNEKVLSKYEVAEHILNIMDNEKKKGRSEVTIVSGVIHKSLGLSNRMPTVCSAMRSLIRDGDVILHTTPSGNSSTIKILYKL